MVKQLLLIIFALSTLGVSAQTNYDLQDDRENNRCKACTETLNAKPPEVLFGINIHSNGDVFFSMTNKEWFKKIFNSDGYGISADIISKERYDCTKDLTNTTQLLRGHVLKPVYRPELERNLTELSDGQISMKIGKLPASLLNKELEGNIMIINAQSVCYYSFMINIDRNVWELLPMGLYGDSLVNTPEGYDDKNYDFFTYEKKIQVVVPFLKSKTVYNESDIKPLYDSLQLQDFLIRKIDIRAYASVEGPEKINLQLMKGRADAMITALKKIQPSLGRVTVATAENWLEFFDGVRETAYLDYATLPKEEVKRKLLDKTISSQLEPLLATHRKAIVTVYLQRKTLVSAITDKAIIGEFNKAVTEQNIQKARAIQKELVNRITDNKLPADYIDQLEVPETRAFLTLLSDREIYRFALSRTSAYEAMENFISFRQLDSLNAKINYNINALRFFLWRNDGQIPDKPAFVKSIHQLSSLGINSSLVKRMLINYNIMMCGEYMRTYNYKAKDEALLFIRDNYNDMQLTDVDRYSLAKYFAYYAQRSWAEEIVEPRVDKLDVSENLVFYYVNLGFYDPSKYETENFRKGLLNAINLNRIRFCNFFLPNDKGGASIQLLEQDVFRDLYCEVCTKRTSAAVSETAKVRVSEKDNAIVQKQ